MPKTQEQKEADTALEEAIQKATAAYDLRSRPDAMLSEFVIVVEETVWDEDDILTDILILFRNGTMKLSTCLGILMQGLDKMRSNSRDDDDDDDD